MNLVLLFMAILIHRLNRYLLKLNKPFVTVRKRSLRRLCFYTWLSFCSQWGCLDPGPGGRLGGSGQGGVFKPRPGRGCPGPGLGGPGPGWGVSRPRSRGMCIPACTESDPPPADGYCCGWYASYWNAFLLQDKVASISQIKCIVQFLRIALTDPNVNFQSLLL